VTGWLVILVAAFVHAWAWNGAVDHGRHHPHYGWWNWADNASLSIAGIGFYMVLS
jgi:hypothetical protein